jgi:hypothetical protein
VGIGKFSYEKSKENTAFFCHRGLFLFNKMLFGLSKAPEVFQELMDIVLQDQDDFSIAYLDDILDILCDSRGTYFTYSKSI